MRKGRAPAVLTHPFSSEGLVIDPLRSMRESERAGSWLLVLLTLGVLEPEALPSILASQELSPSTFTFHRWGQAREGKQGTSLHSRGQN